MRYSVVLVPFPFDDLSGAKVRPAVCLTEVVGAHRQVVLAFITSNVAAKLEESDLVLDAADPDFKSTGLKVRSALRLHRLMTVSAAIIHRQLGVLSASQQEKVRARLRTVFAL